MDLLLLSNILVWMLVLGLSLAVLALARQVGVLHERIAPMGALTMDTGPRVGELAPAFSLPALGGEVVQVGGARLRDLLVFFLSPSCPVCKKLLPVVRSVATSEAAHLDVVLASDGEKADHVAFYESARLAPFPYVLSQELGMRYRISKLPYALLIRADGGIAAKGLVNSREQLESLLTAAEMGVASVQEYLARQAV